ncbi:hypothetical protein CBM2633_P30009 [Cupriavidus taiwanensis]|uniref:Uncharacterized protein n=3 Tax=Cupriavidus TaxID=106589 RepID=A0A375GNH2_9BURK|nr:hypothetical protein pRALTA_0019 [Cupriavidus taiwanensis LMG 19424]SOY75422.1 hypothetical protein CBM2592_P30009 [Cupriavidus taiwanensis]SOZ40579.1 hypothetical protein CBM2605_P30009 [Cupriavidus neocaledonicus]SOY75423.1 hypothetical protein CBM2588_P30009 [Cupriavidus taiwanensis]SOY75746.1 hypothetical protein CBM2585_P30009 [Cupriavidus taiwanensis]
MPLFSLHVVPADGLASAEQTQRAAAHDLDAGAGRVGRGAAPAERAEAEAPWRASCWQNRGWRPQARRRLSRRRQAGEKLDEEQARLRPPPNRMTAATVVSDIVACQLPDPRHPYGGCQGDASLFTINTAAACASIAVTFLMT